LKPGGVLLLDDLIYDFQPADASEVFARWLEPAAAVDPSVGYTREDFAEHIRTENSSFRWLFEPMLEAAGFEVLRAEFERSLYCTSCAVSTRPLLRPAPLASHASPESSNNPWPLERKEMAETIVALSERLSERINRVMGELTELGPVRPRLLADEAIELRPWPASPELSQKVTEIFERARMKEVQPWVWRVAKPDGSPRPRSSRAIRMRTVGALTLLGALVGAMVGILKLRRARLSD
jgi:hypothetical protein